MVPSSSPLRALAVLLVLGGTTLADPPTPVGADGAPVALEVTEFATGLSFPYGMALADDGSLLVGVSRPDGNFLKSEGAVVRLVDADGDGVADGAGVPLIEGLVGVVTALARAGPFLLVTSAQARAERIQVLRVGGGPGDPLTHAGAITFDFATGRLHASYALAVRPVAGEGGAWDVFFNVGSTANVSSDPVEAPVAGLLTGTVLPDSLYRFVLRDGPGGVGASDLRHVARGLRNASAISFAPDGALLFVDNGIDREENKNEQFSADELNVLAPDDGDGGAVPDFGFPTGYVAYRTGEVVGGGLQPLHVFQPLGAAEAEGAASMTPAPPLFPPGLRDGVFIGFHGKFDDHGPANEENPVVFASRDGATSFHFLSVDEPDIGHVNGLLATDDALYLSDLTGTGSLFVDVGATGVVYRIRSAQVTADATGDGRVDGDDLDVLVAHYLQQRHATVRDGDFDGDGDVDDRDLLVWATNFGSGTPAGRREPPSELLAGRFLVLPGLDHVHEITAPLVDAASDRISELDALPERTREQDRDRSRLLLFVKRQRKPRSRVRADFSKLVQATRRVRKLVTAPLPQTAFDEAFRRAELALVEQVEAAEDTLATGAGTGSFRSIERRLASAAELQTKASAATDDRTRAAVLRKAYARAESAAKRGRKLLGKRGADLPALRVRSGDVVGVAGARVAVSRAEETPIAGVSLLVPRDALQGLQTIHLSPADDAPPPPDGTTPVGTAVRVEFDDRVFSAPATICIPVTLPVGSAAEDILLVITDVAGTRLLTDLDLGADGKVRAPVDGSGTYRIGLTTR